MQMQMQKYNYKAQQGFKDLIENKKEVTKKLNLKEFCIKYQNKDLNIKNQINKAEYFISFNQKNKINCCLSRMKINSLILLHRSKLKIIIKLFSIPQFKMLDTCALDKPSFLPYAETFVTVMHHYLSGTRNSKISICKTLSIHKPVIVPIENASADCVEVEDFLALLEDRIDIELPYKKELTKLKDDICELYEEWCEFADDDIFVRIITEHKQKLIDNVFDATKIDEKMLAEKFYNDMMNGFEAEALENFENIAHAIFWKPLMRPMPIGLIDKIKELIEGFKSQKSIGKLREATCKINDYVLNQLKVIQIQENQFESAEELKQTLQRINDDRKICHVNIEGLTRFQNIIAEYRYKCIDEIEINIHTKLYLASKINFVYEGLVLKETVSYEKIEILFENLQKGLKKLFVSFEGSNTSMCKALENTVPRLTILNWLDLSFMQNQFQLIIQWRSEKKGQQIW